MSTRETEIRNLQKDWAENSRWQGIKRDYSAEDVIRLRGSISVQHTLAQRGATRLWEQLHSEPFVNSLGALTGNQAMQQVKAGLKAIYLSGWQVAGDANWSSKCTPAAPASIMDFISSKAFSTPPKPASASATMGAK